MGATIQSIFDWLVDGGPGAPTPVHIVGTLGPQLVEAGVPVDYVEAFVRTLHPHIAGRSFVWLPGKSVEVRENTFAYLNSPEFLLNPASAVFEKGEPVRCRLSVDGVPAKFPHLETFRAQGYTDYLAGPLHFISGQNHAIAFATRAKEGFSEAHVQDLLKILRPLSRVAEIFALARTAVNLLNTYVGRNTGERIMAGRIRRGETDTINAVIWFSDLRGFTAMASGLDPGSLILVLNDLFECQVPAIERHGGEVLKFMGDGLMAIFPVRDGASLPKLCDTALDAADDALGALASLNERRRAKSLPDIRFGLALHVGDVSYGNIGGAGRLDFTCIGTAVNLASRLEALTGKLMRPVVFSSEFAAATTRAAVKMGDFELKGVTGARTVFAPAQGERLVRW